MADSKLAKPEHKFSVFGLADKLKARKKKNKEALKKTDPNYVAKPKD